MKPPSRVHAPEPSPMPPARAASALFAVKLAVLRTERGLTDLARSLPRHHVGDLPQGILIGEARLPLFGDAAPEERRFDLGKVQNVRIAAARLDGLLIPAGEVFSFWRAVGRCTRRRGYVPGRQISQGCLVPSTGGGLCLLSNALYLAALDTGLEVVERHRHTRAIPGSLAETGRDATVAWNHIDLRFRSPRAWRLEIRLSATELLVRIWGEPADPPPPPVENGVAWGDFRRVRKLDPAKNACGRCDRVDCARYEPPEIVAGRRVALLLSPSEEFAPVLAGIETIRLWEPPPDLRLAALEARLAARRAWRRSGTRAATERARVGVWARALSRAIPFDATELLVDGRLLGPLFATGALGGREYDVLALRPPLADLHATLEAALALHPEQGLLGDFRASGAEVRADAEAWKAAREILTPHSGVAARAGSRARHLPWAMPAAVPATPGRTVVFPGPTHARKGAYEVREAARRLGLKVRTLANDLEGEGFWDGVEMERSRDPKAAFRDALAVVMPVWVEEHPLWALRALASGVPVIATKACGICESEGLTIVSAGDAEGLVRAIEGFLDGEGSL